MILEITGAGQVVRVGVNDVRRTGARPTSEEPEEEDLLADVERPADGQWGWFDEGSAEAKTPPPQAVFEAPPPTMHQENVDPEPSDQDVFGVADQGASLAELLSDEAPPVGAGGVGSPVLVVDPQNNRDGAVARCLEEQGLNVAVVETGASAREELATGAYTLAVVVVGRDAGWARLLIQSAAELGAGVAFVCILEGANAAATQVLSGLGLVRVVEGFRSPGQLLGVMHELAPDLFGASGPALELAAELRVLQVRMEERVAATEARAAQAEQMAENARRVAQEKERQITGAKSELTVLRQRCELLDAKARQAEQESARLRETVAQLQRSLQAEQAKSASTQAAPAPDPGTARLKRLSAGLGPYGVALEQAMEFFEKAAAGAPAQAALDWSRHVKNMALARQILRKLEMQAKGEPPA